MQHIPMKDAYQLSAYDYLLPKEQIAQQPAAERDQSRLLILDCRNDVIRHQRFDAISKLFSPGDLLVVNNTKVFPARLRGKKATGGKVEMLLLHFPEPVRQQAHGQEEKNQQATVLTLIKSCKRPKTGSIISFAGSLQARIDILRPDGKVEVTLIYPAATDLEKIFELHGEIPLPPYINRPNGSTEKDSQRYQTKYARHTGSVAAPTAGLHFSDSLIKQIEAIGIRRVAVTLHVGYGTFAPVRCADIRKHQIHREYVRIPAATAEAVNAVRTAGGRIWAVGTTTARTLEFAANDAGQIEPVQGLCGLYIYPGYQFKVVNNLITNFHLPQSSLLFLVSALAGREAILNSYREAVERGYRFFSYGDAMAIVTR